MIWCLNVGENYEISNADWSYFCDALPSTNVTHLYVSEHVISLDLKNRMRSHIRENRKKHNKHCNIKNLDVISRCTHCWWNPINSIRHAQAMGDKTCLSQQRPKAKLAKWTSTDRDKASSSEPWKFSCRCKEVCSSYEHPRYHPVGRMFQCTKCSTWAHVACILGTSVTDEELEEMGAVLCHMCLTRVQREQRYHSSSSLGPNERKSAAEGPADSWTFRCKCGEYCRSSEKVSVHPVGRSFQCTKCDIWSHVSCVFGDKVSDEDIERMEEALCFSCKCLSRRKRARLELPEDSTLETTA